MASAKISSSSGSSLSSSSSSSSACPEETSICVSYTQGPNPEHNITLTGSLNGGNFTGTSNFGGSEADVTITLNWNGTNWEVTVVLFGSITVDPTTLGDERCNPIGLIFEGGDPDAGSGDESWIIEILGFGPCCDFTITDIYYDLEEGSFLVTNTGAVDLVVNEFDGVGSVAAPALPLTILPGASATIYISDIFDDTTEWRIGTDGCGYSDYYYWI